MNDEHSQSTDDDPFDSPILGEAIGEEVIEATVVETVAPPVVPELPRVWTALVVSAGSIVVAAIFSIVVFAVAMFTIGGVPLGEPPSDLDINELVSRISKHPLGLWAMVTPGQFCFFAAAVAAAYASPVALKKRLRLVRGHLPPWTWIIIAIATPAITFLISFAFNSTGSEASEHLKAMEELITSQGADRFFITALLIAVAPGVCEELIFRGYLQTRLLQRWTPQAAIVVSAAIFAIAHMDPMHVFAVFPLGIWLGVVAWRTGSVLPAILCHFTSNLFALIVSQMEIDPNPNNLTTADLAIFVPCLVALIVTIGLFARWKPPRQIELA